MLYLDQFYLSEISYFTENKIVIWFAREWLLKMRRWEIGI